MLFPCCHILWSLSWVFQGLNYSINVSVCQEGVHQYYSQPLRFNTGDPEVTSYNVTGLQPDTKYKIQVSTQILDFHFLHLTTKGHTPHSIIDTVNIWWCHLTNEKPSSYLLTNQVAALTRKGDGTRSQPVTVKTPGGVPSRPDVDLK